MIRIRYRHRAIVTAVLAVSLALISAPAIAATAHAPRPDIRSLRASKTQLSDAGGKITLAATVANARRCTFSSSPRLHGLPATVTCAKGRASKAVALPRNAGAAVDSYRFKLTATGTGGTSHASYATVRVLPAVPGVSVTASPDGLTKAGGAVTLTASLRRSTACELSAVPAVTGLPVSFRCPAGTSAATVSRAVTLPALTGSSAEPYTFTLKATGPGGTTRSAATETVWPDMKFTQPSAADPPQGYPGSLSCASSADCVATDMFGNADTWNGTSWSAAKQVLPLPSGLVTGMFTAVSCPTTTFCAAVSEVGGTSLENNGTWSAGPDSGLAASAISCASASLCAAIGGDYAAVFTGSSWSAPVALTGGSDSIESVSCAPGTTFCMATDYDGNDYTFSGSAWSSAQSFDSNTNPAPVVSCATQDFCVAVDGSVQLSGGDAYTYDGSSWSAPTPVASGDTGLTSISCPAPGYCMATSTGGSLYALTDGTWGAPLGAGHYDVSCASTTFCANLAADGEVDMMSGSTGDSTTTNLQHAGFPTSISCPTASFCAATDQSGSVAVYADSHWEVQQAGLTAGAALVSISCTSATFCMAVDDAETASGSYAYTWDGQSWTRWLPFGIYLTSVSCTSTTFCMALGILNTGVFADRWNGKAWAAPIEIDSTPAGGQVSCASPTFCAAVDANGNAMTFNGTSWSAPDPIDPGVDEPLATVSCPTTSFCTAMDGFGQAFTFTSDGWSSAVGVENSAGVTSVSCTSADFCAAADESGNVVTEYDGKWSAPQNVDPQPSDEFYGFVGISCADVAFCAAVDYDGNAVIGTG